MLDARGGYTGGRHIPSRNPINDPSPGRLRPLTMLHPRWNLPNPPLATVSIGFRLDNPMLMQSEPISSTPVFAENLALSVLL